MTFLGDEGRDVVLVRRLLVDFDPILIGPRTSIGDMYLGPLYYYLMAPALLLANFSPVGPAVMIALLGVITIGFIWWVGREWFTTDSGQGRSLSIAGLVAASLYAISPTVIIYSRSSWNPNIMPFFALSSIYAIWKIYRADDWKWLIVLGIFYAFVLQSHYLGLLLAPTLILFWFLTLWKLVRSIRQISLIRNFISSSIIGLLVFFFLMSPLVIFDARHGWRNFDAMKQFFSVRQETVSIKPWKALPKIWPQFVKVNTRLVAGRNELMGKWLSIAILIGIVTAPATSLRSGVVKNKNAYLLLFSWLGFALLGLGLYKQEIYDHYYGFFFSAPFLLLGALAQTLGTRHERLVGETFVYRATASLAYWLLPIALVILFVANIRETPIRYQPNRQLQRTREVAHKIAQEARGEEFNLAVIAERNYEDAYQYFLEVWGALVIDIDAQRPETIASQLFAVCEMEEAKCDPTHNPKAEVANFGWSKVDSQWKVEGVTLYKLVHTQK